MSWLEIATLWALGFPCHHYLAKEAGCRWLIALTFALLWPIGVTLISLALAIDRLCGWPSRRWWS